MKGGFFIADKCVVRNAQYRRGGLNKRERHNERKNEDYMNEDIIKERAALNVHFKQPVGGYEATFDKMIADKTISTRGLTKDPFIVDELVFDVNTDYFDRNGGYDFAKSFFEEAYRCAVKEIGGEEYILSAVMHADERNKALSEQVGHDVYHYHLHVTYIPVVDKEIYFKKNNKDPELAGKLREVIKQVSHSKKWPKLKQLDENGEPMRNAKGKTILVNAYSVLQDHFFQHMREAGFDGFERGERGSDAEHLTVTEYKVQQETARANAEAERAEAEAARARAEAEKAAAATAEVQRKQQAAAALDKTIESKTQTAAELDEQEEKKRKRLEALDKKTAVVKGEAATFAEIDAMAKPALIGGNMTISPANWKTVSGLAKEGIKTRGLVATLKKQVAEFSDKVKVLTQKLTRYEGMGLTDQLKYYDALRRAPRRLMEIVADIMRKPPEQEQQCTAPTRNKSQGMEH